MKTHWVWQEPYLAAMRDQNTLSLPERLVAAEKAILLRIEVLRDAPENLPELEALRAALNSLYAREPKKTVALPQIVEDREEYEARQRNRVRLISVAALATIFSFTTGWIVARKNFRNDARSTANTSEPKRNVANSDDSFASVRDVHILDEPPQGSSLPSQDDRGSAPALPNGPSHPSVPQTHSQGEASESFAGAASAKDHGASSVSGRTPAIVEPSLQGTTENRPIQPAKNPAPQAAITQPSAPKESDNTHPLVLIPPKAAPEVRAEPAASAPPTIEDQPKTPEVLGTSIAGREPVLHGSVSVNFGGYPSIRVPPELRSQAVGAKLQIGQVISRVDPIYPEDAERQRIEGTVKLHAIVGTDGSVKGIEGISGPPLLVPAALSAVRQWHYRPTLLGDQPIETGQDVTIVFRLARDAASAN